MTVARGRRLAWILGGIFLMQGLGWMMGEWGGSAGRAISQWLRPLDARVRLNQAMAIYGEGMDSLSDTDLKSGLIRIERAICRNPLEYRAHFWRARALLRLERMGEDVFDAANSAMRRTLFLRWKHPEIGLEGLRFALSRWPLLSDSDHGFYAGIMENLILVIRAEAFRELLSTWARYSRDLDLLEPGLARRPRFCREAATILGRMEYRLDKRFEYLARYEAWALDHFKELIRRRQREGRYLYDDWKNFSHNLSVAVKGYNRLAGESHFDPDVYVRLMDAMQMRMVTELTGSMGWTRRLASRREILRLGEEMLSRPANRGTLSRLRERLERTRFFEESPMEILSLRIRLLQALGQDGDAAGIGNQFMRDHHYVSAEEADRVRDIMILHAETLMRLERFEEGLEVVKEARKRLGDHVSVAWMKLRLSHPRGVEKEDEAWQNTDPRIRDSGRFVLDRVRQKRVVCLRRDDMPRLIAPPDLHGRFPDRHLVQVWARGQIEAEYYLSDFENGGEIAIPMPGSGPWRTIEMTVLIR